MLAWVIPVSHRAPMFKVHDTKPSVEHSTHVPHRIFGGEEHCSTSRGAEWVSGREEQTIKSTLLLVEVSIVVQWGNPALRMPTCHIRAFGSSPSSLLATQPFANVHPGWQQVIAQVSGFLPPVWEAWPDFLTLSFSLTQPWLLL